MSNKNRAVVKDGRLQVKKKRTDRSYLQPQPDTAATTADIVKEELPEVVAEPLESAAAAPVEAPVAATATPDPVGAFTPPATAAPAPPAPVAAAATVAVPRVGAARALQQQGVRKRRDVDVNELARRDSSYAMHELRRIGVLTVMVVVALIVLAILLR